MRLVDITTALCLSPIKSMAEKKNSVTERPKVNKQPGNDRWAKRGSFEGNLENLGIASFKALSSDQLGWNLLYLKPFAISKIV